MVDAVQPAQVDPRRSSVKFDKTGIEVELVHLDHKDSMIWATVSDRDAIVGGLHGIPDACEVVPLAVQANPHRDGVLVLNSGGQASLGGRGSIDRHRCELNRPCAVAPA